MPKYKHIQWSGRFMPILIVCFLLFYEAPAQKSELTHIVFTSDLHFGLYKSTFRGNSQVSAASVNAYMLKAMASLVNSQLPKDGKIGSGEKVASISALIITGDIVNRQEIGIQSASKSWEEFSSLYLYKNIFPAQKNHPQICLLPGNHDISNLVGYHKPMNPLFDSSSYLGIYRYMFPDSNQATKIDYPKERIHYSKNFAGIHFVFLNLWPDSAERKWIEDDLSGIDTSTPVLLFAHSSPDVEAKFFINPNTDHTVNSKDKFENLLSEEFQDGLQVADSAKQEQQAFAEFVRRHPTIKAYFHGHSNFTEFYTWQGPDSSLQLPCIRVDSPLKGKFSAKDESQLSFELITIDSTNRSIIVRECFWNKNWKSLEGSNVSFGSNFIIKL